MPGLGTIAAANVQFESTGGNRIEYVNGQVQVKTQGGGYTVTIGSTEMLNVNTSYVLISGSNVLTYGPSISSSYGQANSAYNQANTAYNNANTRLANSTTTFAGDLTITGNTLLSINSTSNVGIGLTAPTARLHVRGSSIAEITTLTDAASIYPDMTSNTNFTVTLAGNRTMQNPNTMITGQSGVFYVQQDSTGSRTLSWGSYYRFSGNTAPTLSTSANSVDVVAYAIKNTTSIVCQTLLNVGG